MKYVSGNDWMYCCLSCASHQDSTEIVIISHQIMILGYNIIRICRDKHWKKMFQYLKADSRIFSEYFEMSPSPLPPLKTIIS